MSAISRYTWARCANMDITGTYTFHATREKVWAMMMDPAAIASCIPGCDKLEPDGPDRYRAAITIGMAAITGRSIPETGVTIYRPPAEPLTWPLWLLPVALLAGGALLARSRLKRRGQG